MEYVTSCLRNIQQKSFTIRRTLVPFFIQTQVHFSVVYDHHRAISTLFEIKVKYCVGGLIVVVNGGNTQFCLNQER